MKRWILVILVASLAQAGAPGSAFAADPVAATSPAPTATLAPPPAPTAAPATPAPTPEASPSPPPRILPTSAFWGMHRGNRLLAATLSLGLSGLGQLYNDEPEKGYGMMASWIGFPLGYGLDLLTGRAYGRLFTYGVELGVKVWSVTDAFQNADPTPSTPAPVASTPTPPTPTPAAPTASAHPALVNPLATPTPLHP